MLIRSTKKELMMKEIEVFEEDEGPAARRKAFLAQFEDNYKENFLPESWDEKTKDRVLELTDKKHTQRTLMTSIPMVCRGPNCHPAGTMIDTHEGPVPIEEVDGELVRYWDANNNAIRGGFWGSNIKGLKASISQREYTGWMISLYTESGKKQLATHDHISIVKWDKSQDLFAIYLMRRGETWRVGKTKLFTTDKKGIGPYVRAIGEDADAFWILETTKSNTEALLREEYYSVIYGISKSCFTVSRHQNKIKGEGLYRWVTQEQLDNHHKLLGKEEIFYRLMLQELGLCVDHPFWSRTGDVGLINAAKEMRPYSRHGNNISLSAKFKVIRACNILPEVMQVATNEIQSHKNKMRLPTWQKTLVNKEWVNNTIVYSLDVEKYHTYIADGIVTHNCEYAEVCPLEKENIAPVGQRCPIEMRAIEHLMRDFIESLDIDISNTAELLLVRDIIDQEIQLLRTTNILALEHFIQENVVGVDAEGDPVMAKQLHLATALQDKVHKRRAVIFKQLEATREAKSKSGLAALDTATNLSKMMHNFATVKDEYETEMKRKLGIVEKDDYIEAKLLEDPED